MNDNSSEDLVQTAYEIMCNELDHWEIVGPARDGHFAAIRHAVPKQVFAQASAIILPNAPKPDDMVIVHKLQDKAFAVACVQYHSLAAVLRYFEIVGGDAPAMGVGPSDNTGGNQHEADPPINAAQENDNE